MQRVQNIADHLVLDTEKSVESSTENLQRLHWLPVKLRIEFKIICLVHRCIQIQAPDCLRNMLPSLQVYRVSLRSEVSKIFNLIIPYVKRKTFAMRAFSDKGPVLWNQLPNYIQAINDFKTF